MLRICSLGAATRGNESVYISNGRFVKLRVLEELFLKELSKEFC